MALAESCTCGLVAAQFGDKLANLLYRHKGLGSTLQASTRRLSGAPHAQAGW